MQASSEERSDVPSTVNLSKQLRQSMSSMILRLEKETRTRRVGGKSVYCMINGIMLDKRLYTANNPNPDVEDLILCVNRRGMPVEALQVKERILDFFNSNIQNGTLNIVAKQP